MHVNNLKKYLQRINLKENPNILEFGLGVTLLYKFNLNWSPTSGPASITDDQRDV